MAERVVQEKYEFGPVELPAATNFSRADLELYRINHFCPSFVAHVFFNDDDVDIENASEDRPSYAGTFALLGHQRCVGDEGHCDVPTEARRFDDRPSHPLTRAFRRVVVTEALRRTLAETAEVSITIIVTARADEDLEHDGPLLDLAGLQISCFA
jgi:hypothetical protein